MRRGAIRQNCFWIYTATRSFRPSRNRGADCRLPPGTYFAPASCMDTSKHILKQQTPLWLAQHPHGGLSSGAEITVLLVLIEVEVATARITLMRNCRMAAQAPIQPTNGRSAVVPRPDNESAIRQQIKSLSYFRFAGTHLPVECPLAAYIKRPTLAMRTS